MANFSSTCTKNTLIQKEPEKLSWHIQSFLQLVPSKKRGLKDKSIEIMVKKHTNKNLPEILTKQSFDFNMIVGRGGFGEVWIVNVKNHKRFYALKKMNKAKILMKKSVESIINENQILD